MPALGVFPFIALSYLENSVFNLHASVLYLLQKNWEVTWFNCAHVAYLLVVLPCWYHALV